MGRPGLGRAPNNPLPPGGWGSLSNGLPAAHDLHQADPGWTVGCLWTRQTCHSRLRSQPQPSGSGPDWHGMQLVPTEIWMCVGQVLLSGTQRRVHSYRDPESLPDASGMSWALGLRQKPGRYARRAQIRPHLLVGSDGSQADRQTV